MKLGKKIAQKETNPFRPRGPVTRKFTVARISTKEKRLSLFEHYGAMIDLDDEPMFLKEFEALIPSGARYYDRDLEVYMFDTKYLDFVKSLACDWYERVVFNDENGEQILKKGSDDLTVPRAEVLDGQDVSTECEQQTLGV